jgi:hypothetical protein
MKLSSHRRAWVILALVFFGVAGGGAGVLLYLVTVPVEPLRAGAPDPLAANEANRKLKRFEEAQKTGQRGYIHLSAVELNSLLEDRYLAPIKKRDEPVAPRGCQLLKARVALASNGGTWYAWVRKQWLGHAWDLAWQRTGRLRQATNQWRFEVSGMRLGKLNIPSRFWPQVQGWLAEADQELAPRLDWLAHLPAMEVVTNELQKIPELKLYNYPEPGVAQRASP